ncbi:MAG TPA: hypothetical protein VFY38_06785, partial [Pseudonocardia sp.]|nr:hypothetical protein [Pseudonocardia sp.]
AAWRLVPAISATPVQELWSARIRAAVPTASPVTRVSRSRWPKEAGSPLRASVLDAAGAPIPGLFVCGEMLGGLFSGNYAGGTGLTSGAVFGRRTGSLA